MSIAEKIVEIVDTNILTNLEELKRTGEITPVIVKETKDKQWSLLLSAAEQLLTKYQSNDGSVL